MGQRGARTIMRGLVVYFAIATSGSTTINAQSNRGSPELKPFDSQLATVGTTQFRIRYRFVGEPVSQPERFEVLFKCSGKRSWQPYRDYSICGLSDYRYDAKTGRLSVRYFDGRVVPETGQSFCDIPQDDEIDITDWCKSRTSVHAQ